MTPRSRMGAKLTVKDAAHVLCSIAQDEGNLKPGRQIVMEIGGLIRNDKEKLGDYKVIVQRVR